MTPRVAIWAWVAAMCCSSAARAQPASEAAGTQNTAADDAKADAAASPAADKKTKSAPQPDGAVQAKSAPAPAPAAATSRPPVVRSAAARVNAGSAGADGQASRLPAPASASGGKPHYGRFSFGSYGRVMAATDGQGRPGRNADLVAHGSRLDHGNYVELELRRDDHWAHGKTRLVATMAFGHPVFHYNGEFDAQLALRNLYLEVNDLATSGLSLWAGSRMQRGDDIYLLDWWPLDNLNTFGGGGGGGRVTPPVALQLAYDNATTGVNHVEATFGSVVGYTVTSCSPARVRPSHVPGSSRRRRVNSSSFSSNNTS